MNAFDAARDVIFANEDRAQSAPYFENEEDAEPQPVRIIHNLKQPDDRLFQTGASVPGDKIWVSKADLSEPPPEGAFFVVGGRKLVVRTSVTAELATSWWICDVDQRSGGS